MQHDQQLALKNDVSLASVRIAVYAFSGKGFNACIFRELFIQTCP